MTRFGRVFAMLDPKKFCECLCKWTESLHRAIDGEVVTLDGKTLRSSLKTSQKARYQGQIKKCRLGSLLPLLKV